MPKINLFLDLDGTLAEFLYQDKIIIDNGNQSGIFLNRKPTALIMIIHNFLKQSGNKISTRILSCAPHLDKDPHGFEIHKQEKLIGIEKHIPFKLDQTYIIPGKPKDHQLKADYLKENNLGDNTKINVLIDDDYNELFAGEANGGKAYHISSFFTKDRLLEIKQLLKK